jgi:acyl-CoA dehydrogenase
MRFHASSALGHLEPVPVAVPYEATPITSRGLEPSPSRINGPPESPWQIACFDNAEVPVANMLGEEGSGFYTAMKTFQHTRPAIAAGAVGISQCALDHALRYSLERKTFGTYIANHQAVQFMLADMERDILAGRLLTWLAAWMSDQGISNNKEVAVAKVFTSDNAMRITTDAVQIFGGYGYSREYPVEKLMRDVKVTQIYEGTSQVQKIVIGRTIVCDMAKKMGVDPSELR